MRYKPDIIEAMFYEYPANPQLLDWLSTWFVEEHSPAGYPPGLDIRHPVLKHKRFIQSGHYIVKSAINNDFLFVGVSPKAMQAMYTQLPD